jgi:Subtilase family
MRPAPCFSVEPPRTWILVAGAIGALTSGATADANAAVVGGPNADRTARIEHSRPSDARVVLPPGRPTARAASTRDAPRRWILTTAPTASTVEHRRRATIARRNGGRYDAILGAVIVPAGGARGAAAAIGTHLQTAGPDVLATRSSSFDDVGGVVSPWSRNAAAAPSIAPPIEALAPIGLVDDAVDRSVAELSGVEHINALGPKEPHGTMVASVLAAPYDGAGVVGVAPGARLLSWGSNRLFCVDISDGIVQLVRRGARVINISLAYPNECSMLELAVQYAYARGVVVVSASGNEATRGNPLSFPASYEHVITAAAVSSALTVASFSNYDDYVDLAAPGVDVPVDVPLWGDTKDGKADGRTTVSGTSLAAPFVAAAASWVLGARPELDPGQVSALLRSSARDIEQPGWDAYSGYGLVQIAPALALPTPPRDFLEPNDGPVFVPGAGHGTFSKPPIWKGGPEITIRATGDSSDDNIDAYRVKLPPRARIKVRLAPSKGRADLFAFDQGIKSFARAIPIDASTRSGTRTDAISIRNTGKRARFAYIVVNTPGADDRRVLSEYALSVRPA